MLSPAAQHRQQHDVQLQVQREQATHDAPIVAAVSAEHAAGNDYRLMHIRLDDDVRRLASIRSRDRANQMKHSILPHYWNYCIAVISRNNPKPDSVITRVCIWCFDIGEISNGLLLAEFALERYLTKPDGYRHTQSPAGFKRNLAETLAETLADTVLKSQTPHNAANHLLHLMELVKQHDITDHINAKLHRAYAMAVASTDSDTAIQHYTESNRLRPLASIRKAIERLEKQRGQQR